jgi:hypothetical protein
MYYKKMDVETSKTHCVVWKLLQRRGNISVTTITPRFSIVILPPTVKPQRCQNRCIKGLQNVHATARDSDIGNFKVRHPNDARIIQFARDLE